MVIHIMTTAAIEAEMAWNGGDERAASAIVRENDGIHNRSAVTERAEQAKREGDNAA